MGGATPVHQTTTDTEPTPTRNMMDTRRAVTAAICLALTAVLTGLALWIPAIDLPLARSVGFANVTTAAAAVTGLFTLIQFSTGGAVEGLISRILTPILEAIRSLREDLAATREATAANTATLGRIDESLQWLASQLEASTTKFAAELRQLTAEVGRLRADPDTIIAAVQAAVIEARIAGYSDGYIDHAQNRPPQEVVASTSTSRLRPVPNGRASTN
jgi:hypothetical protein